MLDRAFVILDVLRDQTAPVGLAELSRRAHLPKATTFRLTSQLIELQVLQRRDQGYILGSKLFELGSGTRNQALREVVAGHLEDLHKVVHETVHLAVLDGLEVLYVDRVSRERATPESGGAGSRHPLHSTALGKAILAFSPRSLVEAVVAAGLERRTPYTVASPGLLLQELQRIRATGVAFDHEQNRIGTTCVASPLLDAHGYGRGAISVTGPVGRLRTSQVAAAVRTAALSANRRWIQAGTPVDDVVVPDVLRGHGPRAVRA